MKKILILIIACLTFSQIQAQEYSQVQQLINRQFPFLKGKIQFRKITAKGKGDAFRLYQHGSSLVIEANTVSAAAYAINYYLKKYGHMSLSHYGDNLKPITKLPFVADTVSVNTPFQIRYALNYCTYNYTYSFYNWKDWERELDWMALNGVNTMLAPIGTEKIWQKMLAGLGYTDKEIRAYIPGPGFNAWWLMGNMEGWGGPVSDGMINKCVLLQQKILKRMQELGIQPVLQAFTGLVPDNLALKYPKAKIVRQGKWAGGFQRPAFLAPSDSLFSKMAREYYTEMKALYGNDIHYFGGDLFHEGGKATGIDVPVAAGEIQKIMQQYYPNSTWVLQGWQDNPHKELLAGLKKENVLILDLKGEEFNEWESRNAFEATPYVWGSVNDWGGKITMIGDLKRLVNEPHRAYQSAQGRWMRGIGVIPESITANPVAFDLALQTAWSEPGSDIENVIKKYIGYRYGDYNPDVYEGWKLLLNSLYSVPDSKGAEAIFCARPSENVTNTSTWGSDSTQYDAQKPMQALMLFRKAAAQFQNSATYKVDMVDLARQVMSNQGRVVYANCMKAYKAKDEVAYRKWRDLFLQMIHLQNKLLNTEPNFMLGPWLEQAKAYGITPEDKKLCEWNARAQITYWGPDDNPKTDLHEYANKEWGGMLDSFYLHRWEMFFQELDNRLKGQPATTVDYFTFEKNWARQQNSYPTKGAGNFLMEVDKVIKLIGQ